MKTTKTGMVVLNHNDTQNTERLCGEAALCPAVDNIVVADNSAPEKRCSLQKLPAEKATMLPVANMGYAAGNNAGIACLLSRLDADYIIISNPDVIVSCEAMQACVAFLEGHPEFAVAAPRMHGPDGSAHPLSGWKEKDFVCDLAYSSGLLTRLLGVNREVYPPEHWHGEYSEVDCVAGSFFVVRRASFQKAGFFDENTFLFYEEDILGHKLRRMGFCLAVLNDQLFTHLEGISYQMSPAAILSRYRHMQTSRLYFQKRYRKAGMGKMILLYAASGLGFVEKCIKAGWLVLKARTKRLK